MIPGFIRDKTPILHPFLLAAYPTLALLGLNITEISISQSTRLLLLSLLLVTISLLSFRWVLHDLYRAGLITSLLLVLFFSYGHLYLLLQDQSFLGFALGRHRILIVLWAAILFFGFLLIARRAFDARRWTQILNVVAFVALIFPIYSIATYLIAERASDQFLAQSRNPLSDANIAFDRSSLPDVYYIVLDAYAREDVLREQMDFDNSAFIEFLEDRGFYVAEESTANYIWTHYSLASSLNMDYMQNIEIPDRGNLFVATNELISDSLVRKQMDQLGYPMAAVKTGFLSYEVKNADIYFTPDNPRSERQRLLDGINTLEGLVLETSMGKILADGLTVMGSDWLKTRLENSVHRSVVLSALEHLEQGPSIEGPTFFYVHIISPHGPFVFSADGGESLSTDIFSLAGQPNAALSSPHQPYLDQLTYVNKRIQEAIDLILANSKTPPIIILQSDHGPDLELTYEVDPPSERYLERRGPILNAYLLPDDCEDHLYPSISPINTWRVVFNCAFNGHYELLEDRSYWSTRTDNPPIFMLFEEALQESESK